MYVDDVLYVGEPAVIEAVQVRLTSEWKASPLTWASEDSTVRFLGLEIGRSGNSVKIHQRGYVEELLRHHGLSDTRGHLTPCLQEWLLGEACRIPCGGVHSRAASESPGSYWRVAMAERKKQAGPHAHGRLNVIMVPSVPSGRAHWFEGAKSHGSSKFPAQKDFILDSGG